MSRQVFPPGYSRPVLIGQGRSGRVWRMRQDALSRWVVLKEVAIAAAEDRRRLEAEAATLASLDRGELPALHGFLLGRRRGWIVQEWIHGADLRRILDAGPEEADATWLAWAVASAVASLHAAGRSHGDLHPGNILVAASGRVRLVDLGLSAAATENVLGGPAGYLAPEAGQPGADPLRADLFSLGVVLHEILCGVRPSSSDRAASWTRLAVAAPAWHALVASLLAEDAARRPYSARVLRESLARLEPSRPVELPDRVASLADRALAARLHEAARECMARGQTREAFAHLSEALERDPDHADSLALLGRIDFARGMPRCRRPALALAAAAGLLVASGATLLLRAGSARGPSAAAAAPGPALREQRAHLIETGSATGPGDLSVMPASLDLPFRDGDTEERLGPRRRIVLDGFPAGARVRVGPEEFVLRGGHDTLLVSPSASALHVEQEGRLLEQARLGAAPWQTIVLRPREGV